MILQRAFRDCANRLASLAGRQGDVELPGYTHMQHAMPSSVALWCGGFDEAFADAIDGLAATNRRINKNPLGSAAGYGTPGLPLDREQTTKALGFDSTQDPVTAAQLSRGKAESGLLFEITLLLQDVGRMASDLLLFYTQEFAYITLAADTTTGSSIMPQKRNPDVLELLRASSATAQACLDEALMITAKLPSGYHRDLQRLKSPLFRGIDLAVDSVDILAHLLDGLSFVPENIRLDPGSYATAEAYRLVTEEGLPFREAYRKVAERVQITTITESRHVRGARKYDTGTPARRISASLLGRRWTVFFAELVLVVAGILIALAIDGWLQDRQDRRSETIYLQLLSKDLEKIEYELRQFADFERDNLATGARAYAAVADRNLPGDVDAMQRVISALGSRRTLQVHSAAYDDLTSTGNLQLILNRSLRERIINHFADVRRSRAR